ncbi:transcriptional regulator [Photobacterium sanctipauli]|uniref:Transcriptional regulator n=2 Tax=Photobacterium sanctipauli TaxID=1342794 RepID=A0A2T3P0Z4_9GAMM|nr:transcriptional regulator [Photobacterium sanctipauli]
MLRLGLDVGGTKVEGVVVNEMNKVIFQKRIPTLKASYGEFLDNLLSFIMEIKVAVNAPFSIGIGLPGAIDPTTGKIKNCNCLVLNGHDLKHDLAVALDQAVFIANDADCFALSEAMDGAGAEEKTVFGVIIGTGCGGGVVVNKQLLSGPNAIAGEWGHNTLPGYHASEDGVSQPCYCGKSNCVEKFISGTGFTERFNNRLGCSLTAAEIIAAAELGDSEALGHYRHFIDAFARSLASVINTIDPHVIVLGGGLSNAESIYRDLPVAVSRYVFSEHCCTKIVKAAYGDSSGVRGASWLPAMHSAK